MPVPITIPRLGWSMDEGTFVGWLKRDGDEVRPGEPLFELEGEKALQQVEALDGGTLRVASTCPAPGSIVSVGALLGYLLAPGESLDDEPAAARGESAEASGGAVTSHPALADVRSTDSTRPAAQTRGESHAPAAGTSARSTPRARRAAAERGVDWTVVVGTGRGGRVRERDVVAAAMAAGGGEIAIRGGGRLVPVTPLRRTIAARMVAAFREAAPVTLTTRLDATQFVARRRQWQQPTRATAAVPTFNDMLVKLLAAVLVRHPLLNSQWTSEGIWSSEKVHIGMAVDTPQGLVVPVIRDVAGLSLAEVASRSRELIELARARRLTADQQGGGTFTVTNLGMFGIDEFTPILHLPQAAILGVGRIRRQPVVRDDQLVIGDVMSLSLTFDHRVADGADAARFLQDLARSIENPASAAADWAGF